MLGVVTYLLIALGILGCAEVYNLGARVTNRLRGRPALRQCYCSDSGRRWQSEAIPRSVSIPMALLWGPILLGSMAIFFMEGFA